MATTQLLTAEDLARILSIPKSHVWRMARRGEIPTVRIGPRLVRFDPDDVDRWVDRRTTTRPRGTQ